MGGLETVGSGAPDFLSVSLIISVGQVDAVLRTSLLSLFVELSQIGCPFGDVLLRSLFSLRYSNRSPPRAMVLATGWLRREPGHQPVKVAYLRLRTGHPRSKHNA